MAAGGQTVQQQALRDFHQAVTAFFRGTRGKPTWRKAGRHEGFRQIAVQTEHVQKLNRRIGRVWVPKVGWVRFRWTRATVAVVKSYRVARDRAGRWHVAFAVVPEPIPVPGNGEIVGVDRGVAVSAALSTGKLLSCPGLSEGEQRRLRMLQRRLARAQRGSNRRARVKNAIAKLKAKTVDRRKDWVEKVKAAFTSQTCSVCGYCASDNRESQAVFRCVARGHQVNADVNAARNIAAGRAVNARGGDRVAGPANREPQLVPPSAV